MLYPSITDYEIAVQNFERFVFAPHFRGGVPARKSGNSTKGISSKLIGYSGGYTVVYPVRVGNKTLALRCWIKDAGNVKERYTRVKAYFNNNPLPYFVDFGYIDHGILVNGMKYPISYMEWVDGLTLCRFLDDNINNASVILRVAHCFQVMVQDLHKKGISHGDLQDGNIMVCKNANSIRLKLVDYDSIFVPTSQYALSKDELPGVMDYQHPKRFNHANEKADYFSELVIYLSLCTYAERPDLWKKGQEKKLLFSSDDFLNPSKSTVFKVLKGLSSNIRHLVAKLEDFCHENDTNRLMPLETLVQSYAASSDDIQQFFSATDYNTPRFSQPSYTPKGVPVELQQFFTPKPPSRPVPATIPTVVQSPLTPSPSVQPPAISESFVNLVNTTMNTSLIAGILAWIIFPFAGMGLSVIGAIIAVIAAHIAYEKVRNLTVSINPGRAIVGMVLGYIHILLFIIRLLGGL